MVRAKTGETLGALLRRWREKRGLTQLAAAKAIGSSQARWATWESDRGSPDVSNIRLIAEKSGGDLGLNTLIDAWERTRAGRAA